VGRVKQYLSASKEDNRKRFERIFRGLKYFGLLSEQKIHDHKLNSLENLVKLLEPRLALKAGETDLVAMQHRFVIELDGRRFLRKSSLIEIGDKKGFSAMSLTVGVPTAIGTELILQGRIEERGVLRPIYKDIYLPTLELLEKAGIRLIEEDEEL
jgi:saccharopine dehydrogenase-like NADP-dependent oxidoreductase